MDRLLQPGYLSAAELLAGMTAEAWQLASRYSQTAVGHAGRIFYVPDDEGEVLFLLREGRAQLYRRGPGGQKLVVATVGPGAIFGQMALVGQGMQQTYAEALTDCELLLFKPEGFARLLQHEPAISRRLLGVVSRRVAELEDRLAALASRGVPARLAELLLQLAKEQNNEIPQVRGLTHRELATRLGAGQPAVARALRSWRAQGLVALGRKKVILLDRDGLQQLAAS